ncbi:MAG: hypothetical protein KatS3mg077_1113 [Candidatus Binatia bacterium]|nr:MAG: hypothetical protein KatS3mg077_1113 [Candidatus Binatia bacterium]
METQPKRILLCTLGASWAVVPEVFAVVAPQVLDLFQHHERRERLIAEVRRRGIVPPEEVWVATTGGTAAQRQALTDCWREIPGAPPLHIWIAQQTNDLGSAAECEEMRELIFRLVLHASANGRHEGLVLSLAGGRKTMSADLQWAGSIFGARACIHVIDRQLPPEFRQPEPKLLTQPLRPELANCLEPVFLGPFERSDLLDAGIEDYPALDPADFPIDGEVLAEEESVYRTIGWNSHSSSVVEAWQQRERNRARIYVSHLKSLLEQEPRTNWFGLYRLSPREIEQLRTYPVKPELRPWLEKLPKADLHCHLGGVLDLEQQREVARAVWEQVSLRERKAALDAVKVWYRERQWPANWKQLLGRGRERSVRAAGILCTLSFDELYEHLYQVTEPRVGLRTRSGFRAYEQPGDLSGSSLLQCEEAVREYTRQAYRRLKRDGVRYCELRASPHKYLTDPSADYNKYGGARRFLGLFEEALHKAQQEDPGLDVRLLIVLDRRQPWDAGDIDFIVRAHSDHRELVVGVDVAGDEQVSTSFRTLTRLFLPVFRKCLPITIHAGEGESAKNIWQAVYRLHAERVGHGLTLHERPELAKRLRDRRIAVELCPTSNIEVVGYYDPEWEATGSWAEYPLKSYLNELKLDVVICTDNPGISRTNLADEYLRAARMCGGMSVWQLLSLMRAGFEHAFVSAEDRAALLRQCDGEIAQKVAELLRA